MDVVVDGDGEAGLIAMNVLLLLFDLIDGVRCCCWIELGLMGVVCADAVGSLLVVFMLVIIIIGAWLFAIGVVS